MALSDNAIVETKPAPQRHELEIVDGVIRIYKGAILSYEDGNIGYVELGADAIPGQPEFAGIALEEKNLAAADNLSDGANTVEVIPRGSGEWVKLTITSTITIANVGDPVYVDGDDAVDLVAGITNITGGFVGIIREYLTANSAWVQLTQHPIL